MRSYALLRFYIRKAKCRKPGSKRKHLLFGRVYPLLGKETFLSQFVAVGESPT
jgi:hypothetical protein